MRFRAMLFPVMLALVGTLTFPAWATAATVDPAFDAQIRGAQSYAKSSVSATERRTPKNRYTYYTTGNAWNLRAANGWISGFLPGELWLNYQLTGDSWWRKRAVARETAIGAQKISSNSTDLGFQFFSSYARGYRLTGDTSLRKVALKAGKYQAARYTPRIGLVRSRNTPADYHVIMDDMMNLQVLWWGARNGGSKSWSTIAHQHAVKVARDFVRPDGSAYHLVIYDNTTGEVKQKTSSQGFSADSTWARGQAWAVHGFATSYRETGDPFLLETARKVADRFLLDLPADHVPYWDFKAPNIPLEPRDSSAAAIAASGLLDLARTDPDPANRLRYAAGAREILSSLSSPAYLSAGSGNPAVLLHGTMNFWGNSTDIGQSIGDYFYLEAMLRLRQLPPEGSALAVRSVKASKGRAARATDGSLSTAWTSTGKQWLRLDLGTPAVVNAVAVGVYRGDSRAAPLRILVSVDGKHWKAVSRTISSGETRGLETYTFSARMARYVRIECAGTTAGKSNALTEVRIY